MILFLATVVMTRRMVVPIGSWRARARRLAALGSKNQVPSFQGWGMKGGDRFHQFSSMGYNWAATSTGLAFKHMLGHEPGAVLFI